MSRRAAVGEGARRLLKRITGPRPLRRGLVAVVIVLALIVGYGITLWSRIERFELEPTGTAAGGTTFLLVGSDSRAFATSEADRARYGGSDVTPGERADVILALRVNDDGTRRMLLISRDLLVVDDSGTPVRLNETLLDGPQKLIDTLCSSVGLGVDHMLMLRLGGLRDLVNTIGGLDVTLPTPVRDSQSGLDLDGGNVHLDGDEVLAFVGSRHLEHREEDGRWRERTSDGADRPGRAAEILQLIGAELDLSPWSPIRSHQLAWSAAGAVSADESVGVSDANTLRTVVGSLAHVTEEELPVTTSGGALPVDQLQDDAGEALQRFDGAGGSSCSDPAFPEARR